MVSPEHVAPEAARDVGVAGMTRCAPLTIAFDAALLVALVAVFECLVVFAAAPGN